MELVWPAARYADGYVDALERGWSPDTTRPEAGLEELRQIQVDRAGFLESLVDREAAGPPIPLPDGSFGERLPGFRKWMWDGEMCGSIGSVGNPERRNCLPTCSAISWYSVVPWKRRRGYATAALGLMLVDAAAEGLEFVEVTTDIDNVASQRVIVANRGDLVERFRRADAYGGSDGFGIGSGSLAPPEPSRSTGASAGFEPCLDSVNRPARSARQYGCARPSGEPHRR